MRARYPLFDSFIESQAVFDVFKDEQITPWKEYVVDLRTECVKTNSDGVLMGFVVREQYVFPIENPVWDKVDVPDIPQKDLDQAIDRFQAKCRECIENTVLPLIPNQFFYLAHG